jgi:hypothetical protein
MSAHAERFHRGTFTLSIDMGQERPASAAAPTSAHAIAELLRSVADRIDHGDWHPGHTRSIIGAGGERIGSYRFPPHSEPIGGHR